MPCLSNVQILKQKHVSTIISEISGSFGDIGTFLPLAISLAIVTNDKIDFSGILFTTGICNILNGLFFKLPMPLQPMKAIAAEAITKNIDNLYIICSAGLVVGGVVFIIGFLLMIGLTNDKLEQVQQRLIPKSLISGIQVGLGLGLCKAGVGFVSADYVVGVPMFCLMLILIELNSHMENKYKTEESVFLRQGVEISDERNVEERTEPEIDRVSNHHYAPNDSDDNSNHSKSRLATRAHREHQSNESDIMIEKNLCYLPIPVALIAFLMGTILAVTRENNNSEHLSSSQINNTNKFQEYILTDTKLDISSENNTEEYWSNSTILHLQFLDPYLLWNEGVLCGGLVLGLTQLPLTSLNSVISISDLSEKLYGTKRKVPSVYLAISVGLTNVLFSFLGTMPVCHGAGGLAAQHKFGARTGWSIVFLGCIKIIVSLLFGNNDSLLTLLRNYPHSVLGSMLLFVGAEFCLHALKSLFKDSTGNTRDKDIFVLIIVVGVQLATNTGLGFLSGFVTHISVTIMGIISEKYRLKQHS